MSVCEPGLKVCAAVLVTGPGEERQRELRSRESSKDRGLQQLGGWKWEYTPGVIMPASMPAAGAFSSANRDDSCWFLPQVSFSFTVQKQLQRVPAHERMVPGIRALKQRVSECATASWKGFAS